MPADHDAELQLLTEAVLSTYHLLADHAEALSELAETTPADRDGHLYRAIEHATAAAAQAAVAFACLSSNGQPGEAVAERPRLLSAGQRPEVPGSARHAATEPDAAPYVPVPDPERLTRYPQAPATRPLQRIDVDQLPTTELPLIEAYGLSEAVESRDLGRC